MTTDKVDVAPPVTPVVTKTSDEKQKESEESKMRSPLLPIAVLRDAAGAIAFYERAMDATCTWKYPAENGKIMHALVEVPHGNGGFSFAVEDAGAVPELEATTNVNAPEEGAPRATCVYFYVCVEGKGQCDALCERMREAGGTVTMPPKDMFYGSRVGKCIDPYGVAWSFSEDVDKAKAEEANKNAITTSKEE